MTTPLHSSSSAFSFTNRSPSHFNMSMSTKQSSSDLESLSPKRNSRKNSTSTSGEDQGGEDVEEDVLEDKDLALDFEQAFHDLSTRSSIFRSKLIEEFQLLENLGITNSMALPPQYNTCDVRDSKTLTKMLKESPCQLIKFQTLKRTQLPSIIDRRLNRVRNKNKVPLGAWAAWVLESKAWEYFLISVIVLNAIMVGISAELSDQEDRYVELFYVLKMLDEFSLYVFYLEIGLKWLDNFRDYWNDSWNIFDFGITIATTIPEIISLFTNADGSGGNSGSFNVIVRQLRTFRILRTLKLAIRFRSLRIIVVTIIEAFKSMALIMLLLLLITFVFAIVGMSSFAPLLDYPLDFRYKYSFSNLLNSFESLFQVLTLDNWQDLKNDLLLVLDPALVYTFILAWVWIGAFIFKNLFVGVMVSNFNRISTDLRKKEQAAAKARKLERMKRRLKKELAAVKSTLNPSTLPESMSKPPPSTFEDPTFTPDSSTTSRSKVSLQKDVHPEKRETTPTLPSVEEPMKIIREEMKDLLARSRGISKGWEQLIKETLIALTEKTEETVWPRDTLFRYFQCMETLQENMREYQELQFMANSVLLEMHDE